MRAGWEFVDSTSNPGKYLNYMYMYRYEGPLPDEYSVVVWLRRRRTTRHYTWHVWTGFGRVLRHGKAKNRDHAMRDAEAVAHALAALEQV
jgi:hypothetical protein